MKLLIGWGTSNCLSIISVPAKRSLLTLNNKGYVSANSN